jgi:hypothetical protein
MKPKTNKKRTALKKFFLEQNNYMASEKKVLDLMAISSFSIS